MSETAEKEIKELSKKSDWYIVTVTGGKEESIKQNIIDKLHNFKYDDLVGGLSIFKDEKITSRIFKKNSEELPSTLKDTSKTTWVVLPNGDYKKVTKTLTNKYPGYIFLNMIYTPELWYAIRNTPGVLGFLGSSGEGAKPNAIDLDEYLFAAGEITENAGEVVNGEVVEEVQIEEINADNFDIKPGMFVTIVEGMYAGDTCLVKTIDVKNKVIVAEVDAFGRKIDTEFSLHEVQKASDEVK